MYIKTPGAGTYTNYSSGSQCTTNPKINLIYAGYEALKEQIKKEISGGGE